MFEAQGIRWADGAVQYDLLYKHPRELSLQIESSSQLCQKISVTLEKNLQGTCALFYRKKYYEEARTVSYHIPAYFFKLHGEEVLNIFNLHFQDLSRETQWKEDQPHCEDELELNEAINDTIDLE